MKRAAAAGSTEILVATMACACALAWAALARLEDGTTEPEGPPVVPLDDENGAAPLPLSRGWSPLLDCTNGRCCALLRSLQFIYRGFRFGRIFFIFCDVAAIVMWVVFGTGLAPSRSPFFDFDLRKGMHRERERDSRREDRGISRLKYRLGRGQNRKIARRRHGTEHLFSLFVYPGRLTSRP